MPTQRQSELSVRKIKLDVPATIVFSDIKDFSLLSEATQLELVVSLHSHAHQFVTQRVATKYLCDAPQHSGFLFSVAPSAMAFWQRGRKYFFYEINGAHYR